jgi:hypothetical protein
MFIHSTEPAPKTQREHTPILRSFKNTEEEKRREPRWELQKGKSQGSLSQRSKGLNAGERIQGRVIRHEHRSAKGHQQIHEKREEKKRARERKRCSEISKEGMLCVDLMCVGEKRRS